MKDHFFIEFNDTENDELVNIYVDGEQIESYTIDDYIPADDSDEDFDEDALETTYQNKIIAEHFQIPIETVEKVFVNDNFVTTSYGYAYIVPCVTFKAMEDKPKTKEEIIDAAVEAAGKAVSAFGLEIWKKELKAKLMMALNK